MIVFNNKLKHDLRIPFLPGTKRVERDYLGPVDLLLEELLRHLVESLVEVDVAVDVEADHHTPEHHRVLLVHSADTAP